MKNTNQSSPRRLARDGAGPCREWGVSFGVARSLAPPPSGLCTGGLPQISP
jgi:hypothetical protein